jgi:hypothetical protein
METTGLGRWSTGRSRRDLERQRAFYGALFNWPIGDGPIMTVPAGSRPEPAAGHIRQSERSAVTLYVQVRDLAASPSC